MKKIFILLLVINSILITSCTEQARINLFGGSTTIELPAGYKVTQAELDDTQLFYFLEPMEDEYQPKQKKFITQSNNGFVREIVFNETK